METVCIVFLLGIRYANIFFWFGYMNYAISLNAVTKRYSKISSRIYSHIRIKLARIATIVHCDGGRMPRRYTYAALACDSCERASLYRNRKRNGSGMVAGFCESVARYREPPNIKKRNAIKYRHHNLSAAGRNCCTDERTHSYKMVENIDGLRVCGIKNCWKYSCTGFG